MTNELIVTPNTASSSPSSWLSFRFDLNGAGVDTRGRLAVRPRSDARRDDDCRSIEAQLREAALNAITEGDEAPTEVSIQKIIHASVVASSVLANHDASIVGFAEEDREAGLVIHSFSAKRRVTLLASADGSRLRAFVMDADGSGEWREVETEATLRGLCEWVVGRA